MKIYYTLILFVLLLMSQSTAVNGYAEKGRSEEGLKTYAIEGYIAGVPGVVVLTSEVANGSEARGWEVTIIVLVQKEIAYQMDVRDNHQGFDHNYPSDRVIPIEDGSVIGTKTFGPWLVSAADMEDWGDLIWKISVLSLDGKEVYITFTMRWGFGSDPPIKIDGLDDDIPTGGGRPSFGSGYSLISVILGLISGAVGVVFAFTRDNKTVKAGKGGLKDQGEII